MKTHIIVQGFGKMGIAYSSILAAMPENLKISIVEKDKKIVLAIRETTQRLSAFTSLEEAIAHQRADGIVITTPTYSHYLDLSVAISHGMHIFVEKPMCSNVDEIEKILKLLPANYKKTTMVGLMLRENPIFIRASEIIKNGELGEVFQVSAFIESSHVRAQRKNWRTDSKLSGGGVLITQGIHLIDLLRYIVGEISEAKGLFSAPYSKSVEDFASAFLKFDSGAIGTVSASWSAHAKRSMQISIEVTCKNGILSLSDDTLRMTKKIKNSDQEYEIYEIKKSEIMPNIEFDLGVQEYSSMARKFVDSILGNCEPQLQFASSHKTQIVIENIYKDLLL